MAELGGELPCAPGEVDAFLSRPQAGAVAALEGLDSDVLVLGAGGKMGLHLCLLLKRILAELGSPRRVWAASRFTSLHGREAYEAAGVEVLAGDFRDPDFVASLPDCGLVFYLVGAKFGTSDDPSLLQTVNVDLAASLGQRFRRSRIVAFSTGCVYSFATPESGGSQEGSETNPVGAYARSCLEREARFEELSREDGTPVCLVRLNYSVEFRYGVLVDVGRAVKAGEPIDVTTGHVNVIWQGDALNHIVQCVGLVRSPAEPINITGPEILSVREIASRFGERFGTVPRFVGEEAPTAWLSDASRSHRLFGRPSVSVERMIDWIAAWIERGGESFQKPTGFQRRDGKF